MTNLSDSNPRIYVACLAAYNNGYLHGAWIDADQDADEIRDEIAAICARWRSASRLQTTRFASWDRSRNCCERWSPLLA